MDLSIVSKKIKDVIEEAEFTAEYYSSSLGYETGYIDNVISGIQSPTLEFIEEFATYFKVELDYLFGFVEYIEVEF